MTWMRGSSSAAGLAAIALVLAGCSATSNTANLNTVGAPQSLAPVQSSSVAQNSLPPLGGAQGAPAPGLSGQPVLGGQRALGGQPVLGGVSSAPMGQPAYGQSQQVASAGDSSIVTLGSNGAPIPGAGGGSSFGGPEGVWTVNAGASQCRLNLPLTAQTGSTRYRASAPGCAVPGLATVSSWQQVGNQVQVFDENNNIVAAMAQTGNRYIGTLSGGQAISMTR